MYIRSKLVASPPGGVWKQRVYSFPLVSIFDIQHSLGESLVRRVWIRVREAAKDTLIHRSQNLFGHWRKSRTFNRECRIKVLGVQSVIEGGLKRRFQLSLLQTIPR